MSKKLQEDSIFCVVMKKSHFNSRIVNIKSNGREIECVWINGNKKDVPADVRKGDNVKVMRGEWITNLEINYIQI